MMFILRNINKIFLLFFISSCHFFVPIEPVAEVNDRFNANYGNIVKRAKKRHYDSLQKYGYDGKVSFEKTAYGRLKQNELDFLEYNIKNKPFIELERAGGKDIKYLSYNSGPYFKREANIFDNMSIPGNDFKYYNLGAKNYNEINNIELQETYDYIELMSKERLRQIEIARLREEYLKKQYKKDASLIDKTKKGLQTLTEKIKSLLN